jgi:hypothetical protein
MGQVPSRVAGEHRVVGRLRIIAVGIALLFVLAGLTPDGASVAGTPDDDASGIQVCNAYLDGIGPDDPPSAASGTWGGCYRSDAEAAIAAAADARARGVKARDRVKIGLDCDGTLARGCAFADHLWWRGDAGRCDGNTRYTSRYIGDAWNDRVSGAKGYNGCNRFIHFEHSGFRGAWLSCGNRIDFSGEVPLGNLACVVMSAQLGPNATSSESWHHCRNGKTACRGKFP